MIGRLGSSTWMGDENELDTSAGAFSFRLSSRSFDMPGGALLSSGVVGCHRLLLVPRGFSCRVSPCLACFVPLVRSFLRRLRRICLLSVPLVSPYRRIVRLPARSTSGAGRIRFASLFGFASVAAACCLPWRDRECGGAVSLVGVARCRRVDGVCRRRDFRRSRCLPCAFLSVWCVSLAPLACFAPRCRRWSSWADCHRVLSSWLRLA